MTALMSRWTPMFLRAEPQRTGLHSRAMVPLRIAALICSLVTSRSPEVDLHQVVVELGGLLDHLAAPHLGVVGGSSGMSRSSTVSPFSPEEERLHLDEVDDALEVVAAADRDPQGDRAPRRSLMVLKL